jgi:hypothetical protein
VKNRKFAKISTTTNAREKISIDLESLEFNKIDACLTSFKNNQILLDEISYRFLVKPSFLVSERASLISK